MDQRDADRLPVSAVVILSMIVLGTVGVIAGGIYWKFGTLGLVIMGLVLAYILGTAIIEGLLTSPFEYLLNRKRRGSTSDEPSKED